MCKFSAYRCFGYATSLCAAAGSAEAVRPASFLCRGHRAAADSDGKGGSSGRFAAGKGVLRDRPASAPSNGKGASKIPDCQTFMRPVLECAAAGESRIGDAVEQLAEKLGLKLDERAELLPSGK